MRIQSIELLAYKYSIAPMSSLQIPAQARTVVYGPVAIGDVRSGLRATLWGGYVDFEGRVFLAHQQDGVWSTWIERFTLIEPISSISLTFDFDGYPMIAFVRQDGTYGVWYRVSENLPQLFILGTLSSRFAVLSFEPTTDEPVYRELADIILAFGEGGSLYYRLASEAFAYIHQFSVTQTYQRIWVSRSGVNQRGRFQLTMKG